MGTQRSRVSRDLKDSRSDGLSSKCPFRKLLRTGVCIIDLCDNAGVVDKSPYRTAARVRKFGGQRGLRHDRPGNARNVSNLFVTVGPDSSWTRHRGPRCPLIQIVSSKSNFRSQQRYWQNRSLHAKCMRANLSLFFSSLVTTVASRS